MLIYGIGPKLAVSKLYKKLKNFIHRINQAIQVFKQQKFEHLSLKHSPRWVIFLIDFLFTILSITATRFLLLPFFEDSISTPKIIASIFIVLINLYSFYLYKTFLGVIRYSGLVDALKIISAITASFITLLVINFTFQFFIGRSLFHETALLVHSMILFSLMLVSRLIYKLLYDILIVGGQKKEAYILGSRERAVAIANALSVENPQRFRLMGFIKKVTKKNQFVGRKQILGKNIYQIHSIVPFLLKQKVHVLILAENNLFLEERMHLIDQCLENNIEVVNTPDISDKTNPKDISNQIKKIQIEDLLQRKTISLANTEAAHLIAEKIIIVTGAAGSIGSEIVRQVALLNPKELILIDLGETALHNIELELSNSHPEITKHFYVSDVRSKKRIKNIFTEHSPDCIFHAAAYKHVPLMERNPSEAILANLLGTKNMVDLSIEFKVKKFVFISTDKAVNPSNIMGASKRASELYVQSLYHSQKGENKTAIITTRFGNVLGSNGSVVPLFKAQIEKGGPLTITHPDVTRYFMTIPEACQLVLEAGCMGKGGEIFIFDMGKEVKIIDLARKMIRLSGFEPDKDIQIKTIGLRPGEKLYEELLTDQAKTQTTYHEKIMISTEKHAEFSAIKKQVRALISSAKKIDNFTVVQLLKNLIPEFKSKNSVYEKLD